MDGRLCGFYPHQQCQISIKRLVFHARFGIQSLRSTDPPRYPVGAGTTMAQSRLEAMPPASTEPKTVSLTTDVRHNGAVSVGGNASTEHAKTVALTTDATGSQINLAEECQRTRVERKGARESEGSRLDHQLSALLHHPAIAPPKGVQHTSAF